MDRTGREGEAGALSSALSESGPLWRGRRGPRCRGVCARVSLSQSFCKPFAASGARERLLVVVGVHVEGQVVDLVEGLVANGTFVLLLAAVGQLVILVVPYRRPKTKRGGG